MRKTARACAAVVCLSVGLSVAGCSGDSEDPEPLDLSDSTSSSPSGDESTEPEEIPASYPKVGLEFTALPEASGAKRAALETYVAYEKGLRKLSRKAALNEQITDNAAPSLVSDMESTVEHLTTTDTHYAGTAKVAVAFEGFSPRSAVLSICTDGSGLSLVTKGQKRPIEGREKIAGRVSLTSAGGAWTLTDYTTLEESC